MYLHFGKVVSRDISRVIHRIRYSPPLLFAERYSPSLFLLPCGFSFSGILQRSSSRLGLHNQEKEMTPGA